jgi:hypothetical protein
MATNALAVSQTRFKVGWYPMLVISGLMAISYPILFFVDNARAIFMSYTAFCLYGFLVLLIPFRERKRWAWAATWILPVVLALTAYFLPEFGLYYFGSAAVFAVGQLLTMKNFFSTSR